MASQGKKLDCAGADTLLVDFLYGELPPGQRASFEEHLEGCPKHAREVAQLRSMLSMVRAEPEEVPEPLTERILHLARAADDVNKKKSSFWYRLVWNPMTAAAMLALVVIAVGISMNLGEDETDPRLQDFVVQPAEAPEAQGLAEKSAEGSLGRTEPVAPLAKRSATEPRRDSDMPASKDAKDSPDQQREGDSEIPATEASTRVHPSVSAGETSRRTKKRKRSRPADKVFNQGKAKPKTIGGAEGLAGIAQSGGTVPVEAKPGLTATVKEEEKAARGVAATTGSLGVTGGADDGSPAWGRPKTKSPAKKADASSAPLRFAKPPPEAYAPEKPASDEGDEKRETTRKLSAMDSVPPPPRTPSPAMAQEEAGMDMAAESEESIVAEVDATKKSTRSRAGAKAARQPADLYALAEQDLAQKRFGHAVSKYRQFMSQHPGDPRVATCRYRIAKALFLSGKCEQAAREVDKAVSASPTHGMAAPALLDQASCYVRLNRFDKALDTYRRIERDYPSYAQDARRGIERIKQNNR